MPPGFGYSISTTCTIISPTSSDPPRVRTGSRRWLKRVRDARAESDRATLFLSIGDDHTGSVFDELLGWNEEEFEIDAGYSVYSAGGIDCSVLGNHEFDRGSALLAKGIRQDATFPVLSANVFGSSHLIAGQDYHPAAIAVSNGLRIGLIGLTTRVETRVGQRVIRLSVSPARSRQWRTCCRQWNLWSMWC